MNNRQKAKHFKRLYEMSLPQKRPLSFPKRTILKYYGVAVRVPLWDEDYPMCRVEDDLIHNLRDILKENIKEEIDYDGIKRYYLDIWTER